MGFINKPDLVKKDFNNMNSVTLFSIFGFLVFIILLQILFRMIIKNKRIIIDDNYIYLRNIIYSREIEINNIKNISRVIDQAAFCTHLTVIYENNSKAKISGWLMKTSDMDRIAEYIKQNFR